jgi:hypothetical protein
MPRTSVESRLFRLFRLVGLRLGHPVINTFLAIRHVCGTAVGVDIGIHCKHEH